MKIHIESPTGGGGGGVVVVVVVVVAAVERERERERETTGTTRRFQICKNQLFIRRYLYVYNIYIIKCK